MRITESKLRSIIRSVIRESYGTDFRGVKARQTREYQKHPNRRADSRERKALRDEAKQKAWETSGQFNHDVDSAFAALVDYYNRPEGQPQTKGMSGNDILNLIFNAQRGYNDQAPDPETTGAQEELAEMLGEFIYGRYIGNTKFWAAIFYKFEDEGFTGL
jgi:hypothetical protein